MFVVGQRTLRQLLEYRAQVHPHKTLLIYEDSDGIPHYYSYAQFNVEVNRAANTLYHLGVRKGSYFHLHLPNSPEFLFFWFAGAKVGAIMVPTNILSTADELAYIIDHSEAVVSITRSEFVPAIRASRSETYPVLVLDSTTIPNTVSYETLRKQASAELLPVDLHPTDVVSVLYTSGTTARPKGAVLTNANYLYTAEIVSKAIRLEADDRNLVVLPLFHGNAQYYSTMPTLLVGASLALMDRFSASRYFEQAIRYEVTVGSLFAAPMRMILAQPHNPAHRQNRLRVVMFAQSIMAVQLAEWNERFGDHLTQLYGMTETVGPPFMNPLDPPRNNLSIGLPTLGYECRIVDEDGDDVPSGTIGQLVVRGTPGWTIMQGYLKNEEATISTIRDSWLWTGDNVWMDDSGYVFFIDRAKDMLKRGGENIAASEVEDVLKRHPGVFDCAVLGVPDPVRDEAIKAFVMRNENQQVTEAELITWCRQYLSGFKVPEFIEFCEELPRTSVGKIQKHLLRSGQYRRSTTPYHIDQ